MEDYECSRPCPDSECPGTAEPEEELASGGVLRWFQCGTCSMEFGYQLTRSPEGVESACSLGVPESVRRKVSMLDELTPAEQARLRGFRSADKVTPVFLGEIGRRPQ